MSQLKMGWAEVNITPGKKISLSGQFAERISEYVEKPLTATVLAIDSGEDQAILCSCDLAAIFWNIVQDVRDRFAGNTMGLDPQKIVINAIHTHTGPVLPGERRCASENSDISLKGTRQQLEAFLAPGQKYVEKVNITDNPEIATPEECHELLIDRLYQAIVTAWQNREAASFSNAFGRAAVGMCRRAAYSDDTAQMWGDTNTAVFEALEGGNDSGIELLYIFGREKELTGIVINLACPAQCVQHRLFVSPDFWGEVKVRLRKHFGQHIYILPQCSAAGDQCPVDLVRWVEPYSDINDPNCVRVNPPKRKADPSMFDLEGMYKVGKRIANEVIEVWNEGLDEPQENVILEHRVRDLQLPLRRATLTEVKEAERAIRDYLRDHPGDVDYNDVAKLQIHLGILSRFEQQNYMDIARAESHFIRMGTIAMATNPYELFLDYGNQIKARSAAEQTFIVQLACGSEGYLPTEKAERHGHYSAFISSGQVGHVGGEQIVRETLQNIREMFSK